MNKTVNFWFPANLTKGSDGKYWIRGIASTDKKDYQGEIIKQEGIELDYFLKKGWFNDNHSKATGDKVGIPTEASISKNGLFVKGYLLNTPAGKAIYELAKALDKDGNTRKLGFSIEGRVLERSPENPEVITKCWLKDIAITAEPINPETSLELAKSFSTTEDLRDVFVDDPDIILDAYLPNDASNEEGAWQEKELDKRYTKKSINRNDEESKESDEEGEKETKELDKKYTKKSTNKNYSSDEEGEKETKELDKRYTKKSINRNDEESKESDEEGEKETKELDKKYTKKSVINQADVESKDADRVATTALGQDTDVVEKELNDVPLAYKKKSFNKVSLEFGEDGEVIIKGLDLHNKEMQSQANGFKLSHTIGGERDTEKGKTPFHVSFFDHEDSGHSLNVSGKDGVFVVTHLYKKPKSEERKTLGMHVFTDGKNRKAEEDVIDHLKGFGIDYSVPKETKNKSLVFAPDDSYSCTSCKKSISKGEGFLIHRGCAFCKDQCLTKALVTGYQFGVIDQTDGAALRVESLEGDLRDLDYGGQSGLGIDLKGVKEARFSTHRANGGATQVSLQDAIDFLKKKGLRQEMADRLVFLLIKENGDIASLARMAKQAKNSKKRK